MTITDFAAMTGPSWSFDKHPARQVPRVRVTATPGAMLKPWRRIPPSSTSSVTRTATDEMLLLIGDLVADEDEDETLIDPVQPSVRELSLNAVDSLRRWLSLNDEQVAELVGIAHRSIPNWRNKGSHPYPATVRRLFETHNLVASLVRRLGLPETTVWLAQVSDGVSRLDALRIDDCRERVLRDAGRLLFPVQIPNRSFDADDDDGDDESYSPRRDPSVFAGRVRTARRAK